MSISTAIRVGLDENQDGYPLSLKSPQQVNIEPCNSRGEFIRNPACFHRLHQKSKVQSKSSIKIRRLIPQLMSPICLRRKSSTSQLIQTRLPITKSQHPQQTPDRYPSPPSPSSMSMSYTSSPFQPRTYTIMLLNMAISLLLAASLIGASHSTSGELPVEQLDLVASTFVPRRLSSGLAARNEGVTRTTMTARVGVSGSEPRMAGSSSSSPSNPGLDHFLDEMNHNELSDVAAGRPIGRELFSPKPAPISEGANRVLFGSNLNHNLSTSSSSHSDLREPPKPSNQLMRSHSEPQIYSECALILQRTYIKNIDEPNHLHHHQLVPFGKTEQACIGYKHIDRAIELAKQRLKFREFTKLKRKQNGGDKRQAFEQLLASLEPPEDLVAAIGELNMATTQIIAEQFDLSNDELLNGLPLIDMSKTSFWPLCPLLVRQDTRCELTRFRTFTGHCNNLKRPTWGAAMTPFSRYLPPVHPDGIWTPRKSVVTELTFDLTAHHRETHADTSSPSVVHFPGPSGLSSWPGDSHELMPEPSMSLPTNTSAPQPSTHTEVRSRRHGPNDEHNHRHQRAQPVDLPSGRLISSIVHRDQDVPTHDLSILFMSWGQLLDHDMTRAAQPPPSIKCCPPDASGHKLCLPISVPADDPVYGPFGVKCLEFRRSLAGVRPNCVLGPRVHQNAITSHLDANFVYGSSRAQADGLRSFRGGRLRARDWFAREGLKPLLPAQELEPDADCVARPRGLFCFLAGDVRANEQIHLAVLHTIYMREHNRLADKLSELNPHWDDERIFQETRHIVAAGVQHVVLNEYLPLLIGRKMSELYNLTTTGAGITTGDPFDHHHMPHHHMEPHIGPHSHQGAGFWRGYDPSVTTSVSNSFAAAAFRQGHTFVQGTVERYNKHHQLVGAEKLRFIFKQPFMMYQPGVVDELVGGLINQASQSYDPFISEEISGHLFQAPQTQIGHDLAAINLQRGREQGLPGYNLFREWCGLPRAQTFAQLEPYLTNRTAFLYSRLYKHVDDIDLWSGGISERKLPGAAVGPTFACIIARQFSNTRRGDRFWYENLGFPSSFTAEQMVEIRKISLAKLLCANSDDMPTIQRWALRLPHPVLNPRVNCHELPEMELTYWQEE